VFNAALQVGSALGTSATASIQISVDDRIALDGTGNGSHYEGRSAAMWFLLAVVGLEVISVAVFYKLDKNGAADVESTGTSIIEEKGTTGKGDERYDEKR